MKKKIYTVEFNITSTKSDFIQGLRKESVVKIKDFGTFKLKTCKARKHYSGIAGKYVTLPSRKRVMFKAHHSLIAQL